MLNLVESEVHRRATGHRLIVVVRTTPWRCDPTVGAKEAFYWTDDGNSSFLGALGPSLGRLGAVRKLNIDLVRVAVAVYSSCWLDAYGFFGTDVWRIRSR